MIRKNEEKKSRGKKEKKDSHFSGKKGQSLFSDKFIGVLFFILPIFYAYPILLRNLYPAFSNSGEKKDSYFSRLNLWASYFSYPIFHQIYGCPIFIMGVLFLFFFPILHLLFFISFPIFRSLDEQQRQIKKRHKALFFGVFRSSAKNYFTHHVPLAVHGCEPLP